MRNLSTLVLFLSGALAACTTNTSTQADEADGVAIAQARVPTTRIQLRSGTPLSLVVFRDDGDPVWHAATQKSPTRFTADVHGPYWVTEVCESEVDLGDGILLPEVDVWQAARTVGDGTTLDSVFCTKTAGAQHTVSGLMDQPGHVLLQDAFDSSPTAAWTFHLAVPTGVFTLYAATTDRIVIRRELDVHRNLKLQTVNTNTEGAVLADTAFSIPNADPDAETRAVLRVEQQEGRFPGLVYLGPLDTAKALPNAILTPDDNQTVSLQADVLTAGDGFSRDAGLALRHPWQIGDDPAFLMPAQITGAAWSQAAGNEVVSWGTLPPATAIVEDLDGNSDGSNGPVDYLLDLSPSFVATTGITSATFDTAIPGFLSLWQIDFGLGYFRDLVAHLVSDPDNGEHGTIATSSISDFVDPTQPPVAATPAARTAHAPIAPTAGRALR